MPFCLSWSKLALLSGVVYIGSLILYRLFFHPLQKFPGEMLASLSGFHWDLHVSEADYLPRLHGKYGMSFTSLYYCTIQPTLWSQVTRPSEAKSLSFCQGYIAFQRLWHTNFGTFWAKICPKMEILKRNFALSHCLMVAEELPISSWQSQITSHEELVEIVQ
jgi:hypothetical protein